MARTRDEQSKRILHPDREMIFDPPSLDDRPTPARANPRRVVKTRGAQYPEDAPTVMASRVAEALGIDPSEFGATEPNAPVRTNSAPVSARRPRHQVRPVHVERLRPAELPVEDDFGSPWLLILIGAVPVAVAVAAAVVLLFGA
jgi:hypothetical protein